MSNIFEINREYPWNKGRLHRMIFDHKDKMVDIEFEVGYQKENGDFFSVGVDKLALKDQEEQKDIKTGRIIQKISSDYTDFLKEFAVAKEPNMLALRELEIHGIKK